MLTSLKQVAHSLILVTLYIKVLMVFRVIVNVTSVFVIVPLTDFVLVHVKVHEDDVKFPSCLRDVIIESTSPCTVNMPNTQQFLCVATSKHNGPKH